MPVLFAEFDSMSLITLIGVIFGAITWLLALSYFLGRYTAKHEGLEKTFTVWQKKNEDVMEKIFDKLNALAISVPHHCVQIDELATLRARQQEVLHWKDQMQREHVQIMVKLGISETAA